MPWRPPGSFSRPTVAVPVPHLLRPTHLCLQARSLSRKASTAGGAEHPANALLAILSNIRMGVDDGDHAALEGGAPMHRPKSAAATRRNFLCRAPTLGGTADSVLGRSMKASRVKRISDGYGGGGAVSLGRGLGRAVSGRTRDSAGDHVTSSGRLPRLVSQTEGGGGGGDGARGSLEKQAGGGGGELSLMQRHHSTSHGSGGRRVQIAGDPYMSDGEGEPSPEAAAGAAAAGGGVSGVPSGRVEASSEQKTAAAVGTGPAGC